MDVNYEQMKRDIFTDHKTDEELEGRVLLSCDEERPVEENEGDDEE
jgi:hypothetical protein